MVLPSATELRKVAEQARETEHQEWIKSIKQTVIDDAKFGHQSSLIVDPYSGKDEKEIRDIFEPLGYKVELMDCGLDHYIKIMW